MKKFFASILLAIASFVDSVLERIIAPEPSLNRQLRRQGGFVLLSRPYAGYAAGTVVQLAKSTEDALIAAGQAVTSAGPPTTGAVTTTATSGACAIAAGSSSIVITNPNVSAQSIIWAVVAQASADGTLLRVERIVSAAGSFTIYGTANATATTVINWAILNPNGSLSNPQ